MKLFLAVLGAATFAACGGKVVVDQGSGDAGGGGSGASASVGPGPGAGATASSSVVVGSSASGTGCDCNTACSELIQCGANVACDQFCADAPADLVQCICQVQGCQFDQCANTSGSSGQTTSGSSGPTGSTGAGGAGRGGVPSPECAQCAQNQSFGVCQMQLSACQTDMACSALLDCHQNCAWSYDCNDTCDTQFGQGPWLSTFYSLMNCVACGTCFGLCANSSLTQYCFDGL